MTDEHVHEALKWFDKAIEADPSFGRSYAMRVCSLSYLPGIDLIEADKQVTRALELDPTDAEAHRIMGIIRIKLDRDFGASRKHHERAMELAPNDAYVMGRCAAFYTFAGEPCRALELLDQAEELDPFLPVWVTEERLAALYVLGRYDELVSNSDNLPYQTRRSRIYRAAALVALGNDERARQQIGYALADDPSLSGDYIRSQELFADRKILKQLIARAAEAGLPAKAPKPRPALEVVG